MHDDGIKRKHFLRYWPFVWGIPRSPVNSPLKGQWRRALMFTLIYARINGWVNNREAGDLRRHRAHYDVTVIDFVHPGLNNSNNGLYHIGMQGCTQSYENKRPTKILPNSSMEMLQMFQSHRTYSCEKHIIVTTWLPENDEIARLLDLN